MARVTGFIDGFNLYHSIDDQIIPLPHFTQYKWLNVIKLIKRFMPSEDTLTDVYFFSAITEWEVERARRHKIYLQALQNSGVKLILGKFKKKIKRCKNCNFESVFPVEKKTDVNIAVRIMGAAFKNRFDKCYLVSGDTDLAPVLAEIKLLFSDKIIGVISPMGRENGALKRIAHIHGAISEEILKDSMFENPLIIPEKPQLECPIEWTWNPSPPANPEVKS